MNPGDGAEGQEERILETLVFDKKIGTPMVEQVMFPQKRKQL